MFKNFSSFPFRICNIPDPVPDTDNNPDKDSTGGFTDAQLKAMGAMVNQVVSSHLKRQPTLADQLKEVKWQDLLAPVVKELVPVPEPKEPKKPEVSEYEKQLAKLTNDFQASERARIEADNRAKASEAARRTDAGKLRLRSVLTGQVNDGALDHVINHLTLVTNRMVVDEDGNAKLRVKRPSFPGAPPEEMEVPIEDGIKDILSESDMKIFLPAPKGSGGSNPGPGGKGFSSVNFTGEAKTDEERVTRALAKAEALKAKFNLAG